MEVWFEAKPFNGFNGLMNEGWRRLLADNNREAWPIAPSADVVEDAEGYHFYLEMAGLHADSLNVRAEDDSLVIEAERKRPELPKEAETHLMERRYGNFRRSFRLPDDANREGIHAAYRDGVLEVTVPKRPEAKPVRIKVEHLN
ncbi:MAG: Hsp20/alpha crystallin family protein [Candidatus Binataceae bacterium]